MSRPLVYLTGIIIMLALSIAQAEAGSFVFYTNTPRHHGGYYSPFPAVGYSLFTPYPTYGRPHCNHPSPYRKVRVYDYDWTGYSNTRHHGHHDRDYGGDNTRHWGWR